MQIIINHYYETELYFCVMTTYYKKTVAIYFCHFENIVHAPVKTHEV